MLHMRSIIFSFMTLRTGNCMTKSVAKSNKHSVDNQKRSKKVEIT
jgi:hypothetical protein